MTLPIEGLNPSKTLPVESLNPSKTLPFAGLNQKYAIEYSVLGTATPNPLRGVIRLCLVKISVT